MNEEDEKIVFRRTIEFSHDIRWMSVSMDGIALRMRLIWNMGGKKQNDKYPFLHQHPFPIKFMSFSIFHIKK